MCWNSQIATRCQEIKLSHYYKLLEENGLTQEQKYINQRVQ